VDVRCGDGRGREEVCGRRLVRKIAGPVKCQWRQRFRIEVREGGNIEGLYLEVRHWLRPPEE
jgi:hypothetical protein